MLKANYVTKTDLNKALDKSQNKLRKEINTDFKEHIGVMYEKFSDEVKLLAEALQQTDKHVRRAEGKVDLLIDTVADLKVEVTRINEKLDNKVDREDFKRVEKLEQKIAAL